MASAWGNSWGSSWGDSWGAIATAPVVTQQSSAGAWYRWWLLQQQFQQIDGEARGEILFAYTEIFPGEATGSARVSSQTLSSRASFVIAGLAVWATTPGRAYAQVQCPVAGCASAGAMAMGRSVTIIPTVHPGHFTISANVRGDTIMATTAVTNERTCHS